VEALLEDMSVLPAVEPLAPMLEPEPVVEPELPDVVPLAPIEELEPLPDVVPDVLPAAVLPVAGVPVVPIGVVWLLCWPAPLAGSVALGFGGVLCAMAEPMARAAAPASRPLSVDEVMKVDSLNDDVLKAPA
jgi:hypothetical protein